MIYKANNGKKKISAIAICLLLTVVMATGATLAYLFTNTNPVENTFTPAKVGNYVDESTKDIDLVAKTVVAKSDVRIRNSIGNSTDDIVAAYIRATVVVNWRNGNKVLPANLGPDYGLNVKEGTNWVKGNDGYYYHKTPVNPGEYTDILFDAIVPIAEKDGYTLHVEILSQSIQAEGVDADGVKPVVLAWGVDPSTLNTQP